MSADIKILSNLKISTDNLEIKDNEIVLNFGESGNRVTADFAGEINNEYIN